MRILHVLTNVVGGGPVYARSMAVGSAGNGDEVRFAAPAAVDAPFSTTTFSATDPLPLLQACRWAEIVHFHGIRAAVVGMPFATGRLTIVTPHGFHLLHRLRGPRRTAIAEVCRLVLRCAEAVIVVSERERALVSGWPEVRRHAHLVTNAVAPVELPTAEERRMAREDLGIPDGRPTIAFIGGLRVQKYPELAIEAVQRARQAVPGLTMLLAGDGPLAGTVAELAGPETVLLGNRDDLRPIFAASDALLNCSRWEGMSLTNLEALWHGLPLVVTDNPGNADACGEAGIVVDGGPGPLADAIVRLFTEPGLLARLASAARARAEERFGEQRMVDETLAIYDLVAGISDRGRATLVFEAGAPQPTA